MDGSDELNSFSNPSKLSSLPNSSNSDENDRNYCPLKPKEMEKISKKKVLLELNEASDSKSCEKPFPEIPNFDSKSSRKYDPFTNFVSPRPRFLRYKPNRRHEIFLHQENDRVEEEDTGMKRGDNFEESDDEFKENDEEHGEEVKFWSVKKMLKFLLVTVSLVLCTFYITSMNTPTSSFGVSEVFRSGFCPILNHTDFGSKIFRQVERENSGFMEAREIFKVKYAEQIREVAEKPEVEESKSEEKTETETSEAGFLKPTAEEDGDSIDALHEIQENDESTETPLSSSFNGFDKDNLVSENLTDCGNEHEPPMEAIEMEEDGGKKMAEENTSKAENFGFEASKINKMEKTNSGLSSFVGINYLKELEKLKSELIELIDSESLLKVFIGLSASAAILTCLVFSLQFKKEKDDKKEPAVYVSIEPLIESPVAEAEKILTMNSPWMKPNCDKSSSELTENVDSFKTMSSSIYSRDEMEDFREFYHQEAPTVQFLGEFEVGEISSSTKKKIEAKGSSFSVSAEEKVRKNMHSGADINEEALSEFSSMNSPSYRSFTTEKKILKKEVGGDGEANPITTPMRRSTRILNRMVSP